MTSASQNEMFESEMHSGWGALEHLETQFTRRLIASGQRFGRWSPASSWTALEITITIGCWLFSFVRHQSPSFYVHMA